MIQSSGKSRKWFRLEMIQDSAKFLELKMIQVLNDSEFRQE